MRQQPALLSHSFYSLSRRIQIRTSTFTSTLREEWLQQDLLFTIQCSTSSVMFQQYVSVLQQAWELSFLQAVQRARDMLFQMQRL